MNKPDGNYVFHGSHEMFETAIPKRNRRMKKNDAGEWVAVFDDVSFHATPYYWIAVNYTCITQDVEYQGKKYWHCTGVELKKYKEEIEVYGVESLEKSLEILFGKGGYVLTFDKNNFHTQEGLGILELISKKEIKPSSITRIDDPVSELKKLGIPFKFIDLTLPENREDAELLVKPLNS